MIWSQVDERVFEWVAGLPSSLEGNAYTLEEREPKADDDIPGLDSRQINESLHRLLSYGLIDGHHHSEGMRHTTWVRLRLTGKGLRLLGEWPDLDLVASAAGMHNVLRRLAADAPEAERTPLVRAAGVLGRTVDAVVRGAVADVAGSTGKGVIGDHDVGTS